MSEHTDTQTQHTPGPRGIIGVCNTHAQNADGAGKSTGVPAVCSVIGIVSGNGAGATRTSTQNKSAETCNGDLSETPIISRADTESSAHEAQNGQRPPVSAVPTGWQQETSPANSLNPSTGGTGGNASTASGQSRGPDSIHCTSEDSTISDQGITGASTPLTTSSSVAGTATPARANSPTPGPWKYSSSTGCVCVDVDDCLMAGLLQVTGGTAADGTLAAAAPDLLAALELLHEMRHDLTAALHAHFDDNVGLLAELGKLLDMNAAAIAKARGNA